MISRDLTVVMALDYHCDSCGPSYYTSQSCSTVSDIY